MTIPFWRNVSIVLLAVEAFVLALIPLVALYFANKGLRQFRSFLPPIFPRMRARVQQVERVTVRVGELIVAPIIAIYAMATCARRTASAMVGFPKGGIRR